MIAWATCVHVAHNDPRVPWYKCQKRHWEVGHGDTGTDSVNRGSDIESREHTDCTHKGGGDNWTQVKHFREGQTITKVGEK